MLQKHGINFTARLMTPDFKPIASIDDLVKGGLREWVPGFMAPYQREAVLELGHRSGHVWHAAGCLTGDTEIVASLHQKRRRPRDERSRKARSTHGAESRCIR